MSNDISERHGILRLLATGKINVDEAADLLQSLSNQESASESSLSKGSQPPQGEPLKVTEQEIGSPQPRWLHVQVTDLKSGKGKVTVNLPLNLVRSGLNIGKKFAPELGGLQWDDLSDVFSSEMGTIVDVVDEEDGEHVRIYVD